MAEENNIEEVQEELEEDFSEDYALIYDKENKLILAWDPAWGIDGDPQEVENLREFLKIYLDFYEGGSIRVTPEGPFLSGEETDAATIAWAINTIYGNEVEIKGTLPTMADLGLDEKSNINEDGSPTVR